MSLPTCLRVPLALLSLLSALRLPLEAAPLAELWRERLACAVAVEYLVDGLTGQQEVQCYGTVVDTLGTILLPPAAIHLRLFPDQLTQVTVYPAKGGRALRAEYLGVDPLSGNHFVRLEPGQENDLRPVTAFHSATARPLSLGDELWGLGLRGKDEEYAPYLLRSTLALETSLPQQTLIAQREVATPGLPVFDREGHLAGLALSSFGQTYLQFSREERSGLPVMLINVEESSALLHVDECLVQAVRIPTNRFGRPIAWLGTFGLEPVEPELAAHFKVPAAVVATAVLEGSPAEAAGLHPRDLLIAVDGKPLPRFRPQRVVGTYIERLVSSRSPGDRLKLTVLRDGVRIDLVATLAEAPALGREAAHRAFRKIGLLLREFLPNDALARQLPAAEARGALVHEVAPESPASKAGLQPEDWVLEVDSTAAPRYQDAEERIARAEADEARTELVVRVRRSEGYSDLRIQLN